MEFNDNRPIWLQIYDCIAASLLGGERAEGERIPSVRETAAALQVNPNTAMRAYEKLQNEGIIFQRRGIGFFVAEGARAALLETQRRRFIAEEAPALFERMRRLGITPDELIRLYHLQNPDHENRQ